MSETVRHRTACESFTSTPLTGQPVKVSIHSCPAHVQVLAVRVPASHKNHTFLCFRVQIYTRTDDSDLAKMRILRQRTYSSNGEYAIISETTLSRFSKLPCPSYRSKGNQQQIVDMPSRSKKTRHVFVEHEEYLKAGFSSSSKPWGTQPNQLPNMPNRG